MIEHLYEIWQDATSRSVQMTAVRSILHKSAELISALSN